MSEDRSSDSRAGGDPPRNKQAAAGAAKELLERIRRLAARGRQSAEALAQRIVRRALGDVPHSPPAASPAVVPERPSEPAPAGEEANGRSTPEAAGVAPPVEGELSPERLAAVDEELPELPPDYGDRRVVLLARDPQWLFCYWDLSAVDREPPAREGRLALRLHDATDIDLAVHPSWSQHIFPLDKDERWRHLPLPQLDRHYIAEVGYLWPSGAFQALACSDVAEAPPIGPAVGGPPALEATVELDAPLPGLLTAPPPTPPSAGGPGAARAAGSPGAPWSGAGSSAGFWGAYS